jgi:hypothetical protein
MLPARTLKTAALCFFGLFLACTAPISAQSILYGTTGGGSPGSLYTIDPSTGGGTLVGLLVDGSANPYAVTGLAFDSTGTLYGSTSSNSPTGAGQLVTINPMSGLVTVIGSFGTGSTMGDLTFDSANATLYGTNTLNADLYSINLGNGAATLVGASGIATPVSGVGLAADSTGVLYGVPKNADGNLYTYSTLNGAASPGAALIGGPFAANGSLGALAFNSSGTLYGVDINRADITTPRASELVTINTSTGVVIDVGTIMDMNGDIPQFDAIVFAVPESSTWLAAALSLGAILIGFRRRRALVVSKGNRS